MTVKQWAASSNPTSTELIYSSHAHVGLMETSHWNNCRNTRTPERLNIRMHIPCIIDDVQCVLDSCVSWKKIQSVYFPASILTRTNPTEHLDNLIHHQVYMIHLCNPWRSIHVVFHLSMYLLPLQHQCMFLLKGVRNYKDWSAIWLILQRN